MMACIILLSDIDSQTVTEMVKRAIIDSQTVTEMVKRADCCSSTNSLETAPAAAG